MVINLGFCRTLLTGPDHGPAVVFATRPQTSNHDAPSRRTEAVLAVVGRRSRSSAISPFDPSLVVIARPVEGRKADVRRHAGIRGRWRPRCLTSGSGSTDFSGTTCTSRSGSRNCNAKLRKRSRSFDVRCTSARHDGLPGGGTYSQRFPRNQWHSSSSAFPSWSWRSGSLSCRYSWCRTPTIVAARRKRSPPDIGLRVSPSQQLIRSPCP
jgi:hypothetical protein